MRRTWQTEQMDAKPHPEPGDERAELDTRRAKAHFWQGCGDSQQSSGEGDAE